MLGAQLQDVSDIVRVIRPLERGVEQALAQVVPYIKQHAMDTGNPLYSQLEFAKASRDLAVCSRNYLNSLWQPFAKEKLLFEGESAIHPLYEGELVNSGHLAISLGDLSNRIDRIHRVFYPERNPRTATSPLTAEGLAIFIREAAVSRNRFFQEVAIRTGLQPEEIRLLLESSEYMMDIADAVEAARNARRFGGEKAGPLSGGPDFVPDKNMRAALRPIVPQRFPFPVK